jgi:hypothetical protein
MFWAGLVACYGLSIGAVVTELYSQQCVAQSVLIHARANAGEILIGPDEVNRISDEYGRRGARFSRIAAVCAGVAFVAWLVCLLVFLTQPQSSHVRKALLEACLLVLFLYVLLQFLLV